MGLLDNVIKSLGGGSGQQSNLSQLYAIWQWVQEQGGVEALLGKLQQGGLAEVLSSWIGTGSNQLVSSDKVRSAVGEGDMQSLADKLGTDKQDASSQLAQLLPTLIDKLSPHGQLDNKVTGQDQMDLGAMVDNLFKKS